MDFQKGRPAGGQAICNVKGSRGRVGDPLEEFRAMSEERAARKAYSIDEARRELRPWLKAGSVDQPNGTMIEGILAALGVDRQERDIPAGVLRKSRREELAGALRP